MDFGIWDIVFIVGLTIFCLYRDFKRRFQVKENEIDKVLAELVNTVNRKACFRTVIAFCDGKGEYLFEGTVTGKIAEEMIGENGFGYDPIFMPDGFSKSFADMTFDEKNKVSHRSMALQNFAKFLSLKG